MSDYEDYDYGADLQAHEPLERGLTATTVLQIRKFVLGDYDGPVEPLVEDRPEVLALSKAQGTPPLPRSAGRFTAGQSGNPNGRPRKGFSSDSVPTAELDLDLLAATVSSIVEREIQVNVNGESVPRPLHAVIAEVQVQKAARGNTAAARYVDSMVTRAKRVEALARAREYAIWKSKRTRYSEIHNSAHKHRTAGLYWGCPHPDDIILGPGHQVKVVGPMDPEELLRTRKRYERAGFWMLLATYEGWLKIRRAKRHPDCPHVHAELVSAYMFEAEQKLLPPRLRIAHQEIAAQVATWSNLAGRSLHDLLRAEAAKVDMPVPPRALRTPFTLLHPMSADLVPEPAPVESDLKASAVPHRPVGDILRRVWQDLTLRERTQP